MKPMQFSQKTINSLFKQKKLSIPIDNEAFGLQNIDQFEQKFQYFTERQNYKEHTSMSNRSSSSMRSIGDQLHQYSSLIQQAVLYKTPELLKFCNSFGIPFKELEKIQNVDDREAFVTECMSKYIKEQVQSNNILIVDFINRQELRDVEYRVQEWTDYQKLKQRERTLNIFEWLDVNSKYQHLRKKLQYALIDTLTVDGNPKRINQYFTKGHSRSNSASTSATRRRQISLIEPLVIKPKQTVMDHKIVSIKWTVQQESIYKKSQNKGATVGLYPFIQKTILDNVGQSLWSQQREAILQKYTEGGALTSDEVKFIANTSQLLNGCADKEFIQKTIDYLDREIIDTIENGIAESILEIFQKMEDQVKKARQIWLKQQNNENHQLVKQQSHKLLKKIEQQINVKKQQRIKRKMIAIFRDVQRKNEKEEQQLLDKEQYIQQQSGKNRIVLRFKEKLMEIVRKNKAKKITQLKQGFIDRNVPKKQKLLFKINNQLRDTEYVKRLFHPTSKLLIPPEEAQTNKSKQQPIMNNEEEQRYRLGIRSNSSRTQFIEYLSGGPIQDRPYANKSLRDPTKDFYREEYDKPHAHKWITPEIEIAAINKIKASIRAYIQRKKYKNDIFNEEYQQRQEEQRRKHIQHNVKVKIIQKTFMKTLRSASQRTLHTKEQSSSPEKKARSYSQMRRLEDMKLKTRKLFQAAQKKCLAIALQSGFLFTEEEANFRDQVGRTPLSYSAELGDEQTTNYLLQLGGNVNIQDRDGNTPTHFAFKSNNIQIIIKFVHYGADLNILNKQGLTPVAYGSSEVNSKLNLMNSVSYSNGKTKFDNNSSLNKKYPKIIEPESRAEMILTERRQISKFS